MALQIDPNQAAQFYQQGTANSAGKWQSNAARAATDWERAAKSPQAEQNYAAGVQFAAANQLRLRGLANTTANDFARGVGGAGSIYAQKTQANVGKWVSNVAPYFAVINRVVPSLPPSQAGQARQNIMNRVVPVAEALQQARLGGAATTTYQPTGTTGTFY